MNSGRGDLQHVAAGGLARHIPVLRAEVLQALAPHAGGLYLDATFGAGGYSAAILATSDTKVLALDRDPRAIAGGFDLVEAAAGRLTLVEAQFSELDQVAKAQGVAALDGIVFDIGVSSMQLDEAGRGFSFRNEGPLDMRMSGRGESATDLVNQADEAVLADIFYHFGEERAARRIAKAIVAARAEAPITTTAELASLISRVVPARPGAIHPATRSFQALRIAVNDELGELVAGLSAAEHLLKPGGRLAVVSFHSLEDRIVKQFFAARSGRGEAKSRPLPGEPLKPAPSFTLIGKQPVEASATETAENPRARSAKLRFAERTAAPALSLDAALVALAHLPQQSRRKG
ncbi:MAG: 16S rRNA (cytosine(1402)-N(4))-methyltransferase RsmH [Pseudomonadota bacterium]